MSRLAKWCADAFLKLQVRTVGTLVRSILLLRFQKPRKFNHRFYVVVQFVLVLGSQLTHEVVIKKNKLQVLITRKLNKIRLKVMH